MITFTLEALSSAVDPYPLYRELRDQSPAHLYEGAERSVWLLTRYEDVSLALNDWQRFSSADSMAHMRPAPGARDTRHGAQLITTDPPYHDQLRAIVKRQFAARHVESLKDAIAREVEARIASLESRQTLDVAKELAWPVAVNTISEIIGIPAPDRQDLLGLYQELEYLHEPVSSATELAGYGAYFEQLAAARSRRPQDDLMSHLMVAAASGDVSRADAVMLCKDLFEGGIDVPANLVANALLALGRDPAQRSYFTDAIAADDLAVRRAIEELVRFDTPIQMIPRVVTEPLTIHGQSIPRGATVLLMLGAANRDERRFPDPDVLDLARPPLRNVAFGAGVHFCIGAPLARLIARLTLPRFLRAVPDYTVVTPVQRPTGSHVMRALVNLEVTVAAGSAVTI